MILVHNALAAKGEVLLTPEQIALADIDGNGIVDSVDASLILVYNAYRAKEGMLSLFEWFHSLSG